MCFRRCGSSFVSELTPQYHPTTQASTPRDGRYSVVYMMDCWHRNAPNATAQVSDCSDQIHWPCRFKGSLFISPQQCPVTRRSARCICRSWASIWRSNPGIFSLRPDADERISASIRRVYCIEVDKSTWPAKLSLPCTEFGLAVHCFPAGQLGSRLKGAVGPAYGIRGSSGVLLNGLQKALGSTDR